MAYSYSYSIVPNRIEILQCTYNDFNSDLLLNKQPIIVIAPSIDVKTILKEFFPLSFYSAWSGNTDEIKQIKSKQLLIVTDSKESIGVSIRHPTIEKPIEIKLHSGQFLILPFKWYIGPNNNSSYEAIRIDDWITYLPIF